MPVHCSKVVLRVCQTDNNNGIILKQKHANITPTEQNTTTLAIIGLHNQIFCRNFIFIAPQFSPMWSLAQWLTTTASTTINTQ